MRMAVLSGWSIAEDDDGGQTRNSTKLDKDKKDTWADKIHEKQKAKSEKARKEAAARLQEQMNGTEMKSYADNLFLSQAEWTVTTSYPRSVIRTT